MSCMIISDKNYDFILTKLLWSKFVCYKNTGYSINIMDDKAKQLMSEIGNLLKAMNYKAYNERYNEQHEYKKYRFKSYYDDTNQGTTIAALKCLDCYNYQASDSSEYRGSETEQLVHSIRKQLITLVPGYDVAPWGLD